MLALFQRFLPQPKMPLPPFAWLDGWAHLRGDELKRVRSQAGFVLSNRFHEREMRIECGASQRDYIPGNEVRLRYELGLPKHCEMLLLSRALANRLEQRTFETLTQGDQTEVTAALPEEARWLAMFERVDLSGLPPTVAKRFVAVAAQPEQARLWLDGELGMRLARATTRWLGPELPFVAMTLRGRLYVRSDAATLDQAQLDGLRGIADAAAAQAMRISRRRGASEPTARPGKTGAASNADESRFDASKDELRMLDEAIRQAAVLDLESSKNTDDLGHVSAEGARKAELPEAIDGLSVVICDSPSLPALVFPDPSDEPPSAFLGEPSEQDPSSTDTSPAAPAVRTHH